MYKFNGFCYIYYVHVVKGMEAAHRADIAKGGGGAGRCDCRARECRSVGGSCRKEEGEAREDNAQGSGAGPVAKKYIDRT